MDGATDDAFIFRFEQKRHELLSEIESIIAEQHQHAVRQRVRKLCAATNLAQALLAGADNFAFAPLLGLVRGMSELRQECLKLVEVHACN